MVLVCMNHGMFRMLNRACCLAAINSSLPGQNGRHFADNIFKHLFMNEKWCIFIQISLRFVPKGAIDSKSALVQVMAWRRTNTLGINEVLIFWLLSSSEKIYRHTLKKNFKCSLQISRSMKPFNSLGPSDAIWRWRSWSILVQVMACCLRAPSHYLNQCWLIISKVLRHSSEGNFIRDTSATIHKS